MKTNRSLILTVIALMAVAAFAPMQAIAGCGCEKAPPDAASVRPSATYAGANVTLFDAAMQVGQTYTVEFASGTTSATATVQAVAVNRRDLADSIYRPQLNVALPELPLGPTAIAIDGPGVSSTIDDSALTVAPMPLGIPEDVGNYDVSDFQAAVGRDGTLYVTLDLSAVHQPRIITAQALGYPLRFGADDIVFYNAQGFLMQLLGDNMPGLYSLATGSPSDSDMLQYSRHEFNTWFLQHDEREAHEVDPSDPNWHLDGTPHIDHDYLVLAIGGTLGGGTPAAGATPPFDMALESVTLFDHGIVGKQTVYVLGDAGIDSFNSVTGASGSQGDTVSNGDIVLTSNGQIDGNATANQVLVHQNGSVTGEINEVSPGLVFPPVEIPDSLTDLGDYVVRKNKAKTISTGSYVASDLVIRGTLNIDNSAGPVTIYVTGEMSVTQFGEINAADPDPEKFAIYVAGDSGVSLSGRGSFYGVVYAPESMIDLGRLGEYFGSLVGKRVTLSDDAWVHFDTALRGQ